MSKQRQIFELLFFRRFKHQLRRFNIVLCVNQETLTPASPNSGLSRQMIYDSMPFEQIMPIQFKNIFFNKLE